MSWPVSSHYTFRIGFKSRASKRRLERWLAFNMRSFHFLLFCICSGRGSVLLQALLGPWRRCFRDVEWEGFFSVGDVILVPFLRVLLILDPVFLCLTTRYIDFGFQTRDTKWKVRPSNVFWEPAVTLTIRSVPSGILCNKISGVSPIS